MKKLFIVFVVILSVSVSCKSVLDIEDLNTYNPEQVWNDENLAKAYMANLYPIFGNWQSNIDANSMQIMGIYFYPNRVTISNAEMKNWDYTNIRLVNQAIQDIQTGSLAQETKDMISGEALFMRAYLYFKMIVHHGGIPYIKEPQDRYEDDLNTPRNTTKQSFDFLLADLDEAISKLPNKIETSSADYGRIDASFALAFKAKVMLYMASPQFHPNNPWGNVYWQQAYEVNKSAYNTLKDRGYALVSDYANIALEERGTEAIFSVINQYPNKVAAWDHGVRPGSESRGPANATPTWEFIKEYPMLDGKKYNDPTGLYYQTEEELLQNYWKNRDPRFDKSIVWNAKLYEISGKAGRKQYTALGIAHELDDFGINPRAGVNSTNLDRYSGFFIEKNSLKKLKQAEVQQYDVDFIVMRYAEVILNYAETANEVGRVDEAVSLLKEIRSRAGIAPGSDGMYGIVATNKEELREIILAERNIEFAFEGHRFWDLRRLRMLDRLDGTTKHGVESIAINSDGSEMPMGIARSKASEFALTESDFKYSVLQVPLSGVKVNSVPESYYFFPIQESVLDKNNALEQNNNWGGTFNPTLE